MGKMKVHELAKEIKISSKELMDKLGELKIDVKSHLSTLEDTEVEKIRNYFSNNKKNDSNKNNTKKERKPITPVIIRREVTRITTNNDEIVSNTKKNSDNLGVVQRKINAQMNIKYRTEPKRPAPISNFKKDETKLENKKLQEQNKNNLENDSSTKAISNKVQDEKVETKKNEIISNDNSTKKQETEIVSKNENNKSSNNPNNKFNKSNEINKQDNKLSRDNNRQNNSKDGQNRDAKSNKIFNKDGKQQGKPFNKDGQNGGFNKNRGNRFGENRIEKGIKEIMSASIGADTPSKELAKENFGTEYKDKQKANRKFEEETTQVKKSPKSKNSRVEYEEINYDKLRDLQGESNFSQMFDDTESKMFDYYDLSKTKRNKSDKKKDKKGKKSTDKPHKEQQIFELTDIDIPGTITVKYLAEKLKKTSSEVIKKLMNFGLLATLNQEVDFDTAFLVSSEFGITAHKKEAVSDEEILFDESEDKEEDLLPRPPIVVVMGHVDHGKTSLLDAIRETNVIEKEAGGITQHIGAYKVKVRDREICFLDTPGHEAFTAMRARGAQVTDIAIIIVAANDGIMPQTVEAINHAKAAGVNIIVAINKIDVPGANVEKVKQELTEYDLVPEEWGGDTICVPISAKQRINIDGLLDMILLVADMKELKANPNKQSKGTVIEARLDKNIGITASLLVQRGTLNVGDTIVVGSVIGKVRAMKNDKGQNVKLAGPSTPVEVVGLPEVPEAGEIFYEVDNEKIAKHLIEKRKSKLREEMIQKSAPVTLDNLFSQIEDGKLKDLNIILKADVQGSVQALRSSLEKIKNEEARVRIIHAGVGAITESDVTLAKVTNSIIIGFNVRPDNMAHSIAEKEKVQIKIYSVIYNALDDVEAALKGMLKPKYKETIQGTAEVRQVFKITNVGMIAGCYVVEGKIVRNSGVRVLRDNVVIHEGKLLSLKHEKDDKAEIATGYECGVQVENYNDIKVGDKIESFIMEEIKN